MHLKSCTECRIAEYCSKECRKAAWPKHKYVLLHWQPAVCFLFRLEKDG